MNGRVEAVVYESGALPVETDKGGAVVGAPGWFWFPADRPHEHRELILGRIPESGGTTFEPSHDLALQEAAESINRYLVFSQEKANPTFQEVDDATDASSLRHISPTYLDKHNRVFGGSDLADH